MTIHLHDDILRLFEYFLRPLTTVKGGDLMFNVFSNFVKKFLNVAKEIPQSTEKRSTSQVVKEDAGMSTIKDNFEDKTSVNKLSDNADYIQFAKNLATTLIYVNFDHHNTTEFIKHYLSKHTTKSFFNALKYVFGYGEIADECKSYCELIRNSRMELCEVLIGCNVTPIQDWLSIVSHNYNDELYYEDLSIEFLYDIIPEEILVPFVVADFFNIILRTECKLFHYFTLHEEWRKLFVDNIIYILENSHFESYQDCTRLATLFPECAMAIYDFILSDYYQALISDKLTHSIWFNISIVDEVLQPMADIQKYSDQTSRIITEVWVTHFLSSINNNFYALYGAQEIFEKDFKINKEILETIVNANIRSYIRYLASIKISIQHASKTLNEFFAKQYAYDYFMDNICQILHCQGIDFYAYLVKQFKDNLELREAEYCCYEFE